MKPGDIVGSPITRYGLALTLSVVLAACSSVLNPPSQPPPSPDAAVPGTPPTFLNDGFLSEQLSTATQLVSGWGPVEKDRSNGDSAAGDGERLSLSKIKYTKGLGVHSNSTVVFPLDGSCTRFQASIGIDDSVRPGGRFNAQGLSSVVFQVYLGEWKAFDSGVITETSNTRTVNLKIPADARTLRLVVTDAGDGILYDHADWANARVGCGSGTLPVSP